MKEGKKEKKKMSPNIAKQGETPDKTLQ